MNQKGYKIKNKLVSISTSISSFLIPIFQYVPCTAVWFGIMSVPVITYIALFFQNPGILLYDLMFLFRIPGTYIALVGFTFYIYALIFQITHRKELIRNGPYKFVRHPQYLAFIIMTFGMTLVAFQTYPIVDFNPFNISSYTIILLIWIGEVIAYIILGKIEDIALKSKYRDEYLKYANRVSFMFPVLRLNKKKDE
jgi:protein-S-isoprenylcysteine O-methyltransferase Ste14